MNSDSRRLDIADVYSRYDEYLNERWGSIEIEGRYYEAAELLRACNEVAYDRQFDTWLSLQLQSGSLITMGGDDDVYYAI